MGSSRPRSPAYTASVTATPSARSIAWSTRDRLTESVTESAVARSTTRVVPEREVSTVPSIDWLRRMPATAITASGTTISTATIRPAHHAAMSPKNSPRITPNPTAIRSSLCSLGRTSSGATRFTFTPLSPKASAYLLDCRVQRRGRLFARRQVLDSDGPLLHVALSEDQGQACAGLVGRLHRALEPAAAVRHVHPHARGAQIVGQNHNLAGGGLAQRH